MNSAHSTRIHTWCQHPTSLWDVDTTKLLVEHEWRALKEQFSWTVDDYSTAGYILQSPNITTSKTPITAWSNNNQIYIEEPDNYALEKFYSENDLTLITENKLHSIHAVEKLNDALTLLSSTPGVIDCISQLVRVISIIEAPAPEIDVSYSHPKVPFSIFISVCDERNSVTSARVAESILHEAMHLRLSLIQKTVNLFNKGEEDSIQYFAPWRQEKRPAAGVLHGIFVFRAMLDFFQLQLTNSKNGQVIEHFKQRIEEITSQLVHVKNFHESPALNETGVKLARHLVNI